MKLVAAALLALFVPSFALAQLRIKVDAGDATRLACPMTARLDARFETGTLLSLTPGDASQPLIAQVTRDGDGCIIRWIEPELQKNTSREYQVRVAKAQPTEVFKFEDGDGYRDLLFGTKPIWRDMIKYDPADHANTFKTFRQVYAFDSDDFITKGPGGKYPHHRGIFFGFKTQHGDFWHCPDVSQRHAGFKDSAPVAGPIAARSSQITNWLAKDGAPAARDIRECITWRISDKHYVYDYLIMVENLKDEPLELGGDAHHAGFHFRAAQEVAEAGNAASYIRPDGAKLVKDDIWENDDWLAATFKVNGKAYSVAHFDAPTNFRPIQYSSRPYGRLGSFFRTTVPKDKPLVLHYRLIIRDGANPPTKEQLADEYAAYFSPAKVTVVP